MQLAEEFCDAGPRRRVLRTASDAPRNRQASRRVVAARPANSHTRCRVERKGATPALPLEELTDTPAVSPATWLGFGAMCLGMFMAILDVQVVVTSLPTIRAA